MNYEYWYNAAQAKQGEADADVCDLLFQTVEKIEDNQPHVYNSMKFYTELYLDRTISGFKPGEWLPDAVDIIEDEMVSWNVCKACVDAATAKLTLRKPEARFETEMGLDEDQEAARDLDQFVRAVTRTKKAYRAGRRAVKTSAITGTGLLKVSERNDEICIEDVHPSAIIVDENAALNGDPQEMFQREHVSKEALKADWPKKCHVVIDETNEAAVDSAAQRRDMVEVLEAWLLPRGSRGGRHVICTSKGVLLDEEWKHPRFPFAEIRWQESERGWYGLSGVGDIAGCQTEINHVLERLRGNLVHMGWSFIWAPAGAGLDDKDLQDNTKFKVLKSAQAPEMKHPPMAHQQVFDWAEKQWTRAFELFGLSQLTATSVKPPGLRSGKALSTYHDIETQRFSDVARQWEQMQVDLAYLVIQVARDMTAAGKNPTARSHVEKDGYSFFRPIKFKDINLDDSKYTIAIQPASGLPQSPAGRQEMITELAQAGLIDREQALELLDMPDLAKYRRLENAARDDLERVFEKMLSSGDYIPPIRYQDLRTGLQMAASYWSRARCDDIDEDRLDLLLRWIDEAEQLMADAMQPPPGPVPPGMPADPAAAQMLTQGAASAAPPPPQ
jgi:hypothetical protein